MNGRIGWLIAVVVIISPPLDNFLDAAMARHMLLQMPILVALGYAAIVIWPTPRWQFESKRLCNLIFAIGTLAFWMLPRSLDSAVSVTWVDQLMHLNMLTAGWLLALGLPHVAFPTKMAFGIYSLAMALAAGVVYFTAVVPVCSVYTVQHQNEAGALLLCLCALLFMLLLARAGFLLSADSTWRTPT